MAKPKDDPARLTKQFVAEEIKIDSDERIVTAVVSTGGIDRDQEILVPKGGDFERFRKNPVVLWAHGHSDPPIGRALWIKLQRGKIVASTQFAETDMGLEVFELFKGGFLNAFSVGLINTKSHQPTPKEIARRPELSTVWRIIDEWELLEFSAVAVPSNPEALATAVKTKTITLSDANLEAFGIEPEPEPEPAVYNTEDDDATKTIPDDKPLIVVARYVPAMQRHIAVKRHRVIQLQAHISPNEVANRIQRVLSGKVT